MVWYHGINVRAYACLLRVLPEGHGSLLHRPGSTEIAQLYSEIIVALVESLRVLADEGVREILDGVVAYGVYEEFAGGTT